MRLRGLILPALLALAGPAHAVPNAELPVPPVSRWATLPRLAYAADYKPRPVWVERAQALEGSEGCKLPVDGEGVVRLKVPFVALLSPKGNVLQAQADYPACPALAALIGQFARALGPKTLRPPGGTPPIWRASHFLAGWKQ